jgi:hypothetical protein
MWLSASSSGHLETHALSMLSRNTEPQTHKASKAGLVDAHAVVLGEDYRQLPDYLIFSLIRAERPERSRK